MSQLKFIEIKPNSDKDANNALLETLNKMLIQNLSDQSYETWNDAIDDLCIDYDNFFITRESNDLIHFINNFFAQKQNTDNVSIDTTIQYYDITAFDSNFSETLSDKIYLMLSDKTKNSSKYISSMNTIILFG